MHWIWHWLLGIFAIANFAIAIGAFEQRDEARRLAKPVIDMNGTTIVVICPKPATHTAASPVPRQERFVL
jgi:hypothetical protein